MYFEVNRKQVFATTIINETFSEPAQLRQAFNLPVLGTVTPVQTAARQTFTLATHSTFFMFSGLLALVYAVLTMNISQVRGLKLGSIPGFEEFFLKASTMLGL